MKILGLIPARGGSKGVPHKNRKRLLGKPLVNYTIEAALASSEIETLVVSTDDPEIAKISQAAGASVPFLRPAALASDQSPTIDTVIHALQFLAEQNQVFDAVCLLQPTCPLREAADISEAIQIFATKDADSLISVREVPHQFNPHWVFEATETNFLKIATGEKEIITRRQALPKAYYRDGSIYLTKTELILKRRSLYGDRISYLLSKSAQHINIDTLADWQVAEQLLNDLKG